MIGFYDYTVILTYLSAAAAVMGMTFAANGHMNWAIYLLPVLSVPCRECGCYGSGR